METEPSPKYAIRQMTLDDGETVHQLLRKLHNDTYVNDELGITSKKVDERFTRRGPEERHERLAARLKDQNNMSWVATDAEGIIIGMVAPRIEDDGTRRLGALYVDRKWQGKGLAHDLMEKALEWLGEDEDVMLGVVTYNERAKAFYRKWGFEEITNSETLFDDLIPEVMMVRKAIENRVTEKEV